LLNHAEGFVFAPFAISKDCPILVIRPDVVERVELTTRGVLPQQSAASSCSTAVPVTPGYHRDFQLFHQQLLDGRFDKIVLSRSEEFSLQARADAEETAAHLEYLAELDKASGGQCLWTAEKTEQA